MQKMLVAIILVGNLALAAPAALAGDGLHAYSDKELNGGSAISAAQSDNQTVDDPPLSRSSLSNGMTIWSRQMAAVVLIVWGERGSSWTRAGRSELGGI